MPIDNLQNLRIASAPPQQQQQQIVIPFAEIVPGFSMSLTTITAVDLRGYVANSMVPRSITVHSTGGQQFVFDGDDADRAYHWYLMFTGQAKVTA